MEEIEIEIEIGLLGLRDRDVRDTVVACSRIPPVTNNVHGPNASSYKSLPDQQWGGRYVWNGK